MEAIGSTVANWKDVNFYFQENGLFVNTLEKVDSTNQIIQVILEEFIVGFTNAKQVVVRWQGGVTNVVGVGIG